MKIDGSDWKEKLEEIEKRHDKITSPFNPALYKHDTSFPFEQLRTKPMELLQNRKLKFDPEEMTSFPFYEMKILIESIFELCQEGEFSFYEAHNIIGREWILSMDYKDTLWEKLDDLEGDIIGLDSWDKYTRDAERAHYERALDNMEDYYCFVDKFRKMLWETPESKEYQQKRKAKLKSQIIQVGLALSLENIDEAKTPDEVQTPKEESNTLFEGDITDDITNHLFKLFPEFKNDYRLLFEKDYLEKRNEGLHWEKTKQSLAEYFKSIKPLEMKNIPWKTIEGVFDEKDLKHRGSNNGSSTKKPSKDFEEWQKIKNDTADK